MSEENPPEPPPPEPAPEAVSASPQPQAENASAATAEAPQPAAPTPAAQAAEASGEQPSPGVDSGVEGEAPDEGEAAPVEAAPVEPEVAAPDVREIIKSKVSLSGIDESMWNEEHMILLGQFVEDPAKQLLIAYMDPYTGLSLSFNVPNVVVPEICYFIRCRPPKPKEEDPNIDTTSSLSGNQTLLHPPPAANPPAPATNGQAQGNGQPQTSGQGQEQGQVQQQDSSVPEEHAPIIEKLSAENFAHLIQYGTISAEHVEDLLRLMSNIFAPLFFEHRNWPDSIRNEFNSQLHKFLASLTDTRWKIEGKTVLYIPMECQRMNTEKASKDKDLIQRLEAAMIHWTRQIKEVLSAQDTLELSENATPLDEIEFWKNRCEDLLGLSLQLDKGGVKKVTEILEGAKSNYVAPFLKLSSQIKEGSRQAQSNLKFLTILKEPCMDLSESAPKVIPAKLPKILTLTRVIWVNSEFYKSRERLTGLFRKLSNEVIIQCCKEIALERIFSGYINSSVQSLEDCINCCEQYKEIYERMARIHHKYSPEGWTLDKSAIFAQVDAFIQRCKDLLDVCECQKQFARWEDGEKANPPQFGGIRGPEITQSLLDIEVSFSKCMEHLRKVKRTILDVKATSWHDEYNKFRTSVKDLEVMMVNVISRAFETVTTVDQGVELLDVFMHLGTRESIKRTLDKKTIQVYTIFAEEMQAIKREFLQHSATILPTLCYHPKYGGQAHYFRLLKRRIERDMMTLDRAAFFLPECEIAHEVRVSYQGLTANLDDMVKKSFYEWQNSLGTQDPLKLLDVALMRRSIENQAMIDSNFSKNVLKLFQELAFWERIVTENEIPHSTVEISSRKGQLLVLRENVLLVVRDYNRIIALLSQDERGLFRDRIRFLDKKIQPGLTKLTWASKTVSDFFIAECRSNASKLQARVDEYKSANTAISKNCEKISQLYLFRVDSKRVYEGLDFSTDQENHRDAIRAKLSETHKSILGIMHNTQQIFKNDPEEVQRFWAKYVEKMDRLCQESFRLNVKGSLQELSKALIGDGRSGPNPIFRIKVELATDPSSAAKERPEDPTSSISTGPDNSNAFTTPHIDFSPTLVKMHEMISSIKRHLVDCLDDVGHLTEMGDLVAKKRGGRRTEKPIHQIIDEDEEIAKIQHALESAVKSNASSLQNHIVSWDKYRAIWEIEKSIFIERYRQSNPTVAKFESDINRYVEVSNEVDSQETLSTIQFVLLDFSPLKGNVVSHCLEWQNRFIALLLDIFVGELNALTEHLRSNMARISRPPQTLDELGESLMLLDQLNTSREATEKRFTPIHDEFLILEKREVPIPEESKLMHEQLDSLWQAFLQTLLDSDVMLKKNKDKFKASLLQQSDEFKKTCAAMLSDFQQNGPFSGKLSPTDALAAIARLKEQLSALKKQEAELRHGLGIFKIEQPASKDMAALEKDLELIETVWQMTADWDTSWAQWKAAKFSTLQTVEMESQCQTTYKKLYKMTRELRDKGWDILDQSFARVDQFRRTMPLITDLKNEAMRGRHWQQIRDELGRSFEEASDTFTLEKIIEFGFDSHAEFIGEISGAATKEMAIEIALSNINSAWETQVLDIVPYKDKGHFKVRSTEEVFQTIEDHQAQLGTHKTSRFVKPFEQDVDRWERTLSHILEACEALLQVQRQWIYLEQIFLGEDIRKQLPKESKDFDDVNVQWKAIMTTINKDRNVLRATHQANLLEMLNDMNTHLEDIQKSLDMYLETKRVAFPRFYFVSNDDLLEILGQSKNPEAIQQHLKKCFDNIKSLRLEKSPGAKTEALGMNSSEGEFVPFKKSVLIEGQVEFWLTEVEKAMRETLREVLKDCKTALRKNLAKRDKWLKEWPGQLCITSSQIQWTADVTRAIQQCKQMNDRKPLKSLKRKQVLMLNKLSEMIRGNLTKMQRNKVVALVTIEVHARDIIEKLAKANVNDVSSFDWLCQLRFYWDKDLEDCNIRQTSTSFPYGYEYLGNSGRLVITPLTDRCYITLTTALFLHRGGSPKGPAGTGKTETVKDLGKSLGYFVIVMNCSEGLDFKSMGRMLSGLAQTGAWGCFDEFNRINVEVLSVVAQQILAILTALSANAKRFIFEGSEIALVPSCGIFITMNPGYAGRTELPDNLKSMFRPIAMVVPDSTMIAEITLFAEGFSNTKALAKKVYTLYSLAAQQLSKQDHYDFGLRALVSVLRYAGRKKRQYQAMNDEELLLLSMKDMNVAKLTSSDLPLFTAIVSDLFPGIETPTIDYSKLKGAIEAELVSSSMQLSPYTVNKVIQLYETKGSRHSVMIVGQTKSGKSVIWHTLQSSLTRLSKEQQAAGGVTAGGDQIVYNKVFDFALNPKSITMGELYGESDVSTNEWSDGILSSIMRVQCADEKPDEKWIVFDGPVDTLWIESMNSLMDDNKILTLINGERIAMPEQVSLLFEVEDLAVASPATVSRCGMVYTEYKDLGWKPFVDSWLAKKTDKTIVEECKRLFDKYMDKVWKFVRKSCTELISIAELNAVQSLTRLFDCLATQENGVDPKNDPDGLVRMIELWFTFSMIWSLCASLDEDGRRKLDAFVREMDGSFPNKDTIFEYYVDSKTKSWAHWEEKLRSTTWRYNPSTPFYKLYVPTVDTVRYQYLVYSLLAANNPVMLVGPVGTGKTSVAQSVLNMFDRKFYSLLTINMSAQTSSRNVQDFIESRVEKRTKGMYVPIGGKKLLNFCDDFNMPMKDTFGSQPPLELIRHWVDYGFWYDRQQQTIKKIMDMYLLVAMGPPGGGRMVITKRLQSRFNLINMTFPQESQIKRIFGTLISMKLQDFEEEIKPLGDIMTQATIEMYQGVVQRFLPTPTKIHYLYNLRDISKVFQGLLRSNKNYHDTKPAITRLWIHECFRVFSDRLVDHEDMDSFVQLLTEKLGLLFDLTFHNICPNKIPPLFGDFLNTDQQYEDMTDWEKIRKFMNTSLDEYNNSPGHVRMNLVLFKDAIEHVCRIVRVIRQPRGNCLLIGIGGSGRQSVGRLAAFICDYDVFQIEITKHYRKNEFRDDIKRLYLQAGVEQKPSVFLFNDQQIVEESFLEDINNVLSSGEVPNLYKPEEFEEVKSRLLDDAKKEGITDESSQVIFGFLIERVRANLHVVLCMSPVGEPFRNRIRMYPALVNCTTIDWFSEWPPDALLEVAERYLQDVQFMTEAEEKLKPNLAKIFSSMQKSVTEASRRMLLELRRNNYVTPSNYLELVAGYRKMLYEKRKELGDSASKLRNGLHKLDETREKVQVMSKELDDNKQKIQKFQKECDEYLVVLVQQKREADEQQKSVAQTSEKIAIEEVKCKQMAELAQADLAEAMPALEEAIQALDALNKKDIGEIKSYNKPPPLVEKVLEAVMILKQCEPSWAEAKRQLGDNNFINSLKFFDKDNISDRTLTKIGKYVGQEDFVPDTVGKVSNAAKSLCMWVRAMEMYGRIYRVVEPKRQRLNQAEATLREKQEQLAQAKAKLAEIEQKMLQLQQQYQEKLAMKEELNRKAQFLEMMLDRAQKLVSGLADEKVRWEETAKDLEERMSYLPGDCLVASAFLSYCGPFLSSYRNELLQHHWLPEVRKLGVPCSPEFDLGTFLVKPTVVRDWNLQGLPSDAFSTENGIIVTRGTRWPLMIDPQGQAVKWIKAMEQSKGLKIIDLQQSNYMRVLEIAIQYGQPVLLHNVQEKLDPSLDPILNKSLVKIGGVFIIRLGDKEIEYNNDFRFYIATKLMNPHFTPELFSKSTVVNFAIKEEGLEAQLLGLVVRKERPELEEQKDSLVVNIAAGKKKLVELEDTILRLLNEAQGSLLDDEALVNTLQTSKLTSAQVAEQLEVAEQTEQKIDKAREAYRASAQRASILFFVLNDLSRIDPMYQFSLDAYIDLFNLSIEKSQKSPKIESRIQNLNDHHTFAVYNYTCRALFERHKLLFSLQMCAKILDAAGKINLEEYTFFLRGGVVLDREHQLENPCSGWLNEIAWDNITELDKLPNFHGIVTSFEQYARDWMVWYQSSDPETSALPAEWDNQCNELQKMLILRSLRPDRVQYAVATFIVNNLGSKFVEPPVLNVKQVLDDSTARTPLIFVLSPGVDPTSSLLQLADACGMAMKFHPLSLGQGQAPIATRLITEGAKEGNWVFLANCHLSLSWMPALDKLVEELQFQDAAGALNKDFRLWLSSAPHPEFPISILQLGLKMTTEPPKGLRPNMLRLYNCITEQQFQLCRKPDRYRKLLFSLCYFHSVLLERRKFLMLGWNIPYEFNDSDFEVSENLLGQYLDLYEETPWDALKYLIADINYGGHITDDWDRRLLQTYIQDFFNPDVVGVQFYKLSPVPVYYVPKDGPLSSYKEFIKLLPQVDHPEAFGQHTNADIIAQIQETRKMFETLLQLAPSASSAAGKGEGKEGGKESKQEAGKEGAKVETRESKVLELSDMIRKQLPENIDYETIAGLLVTDMSPVNVVFLQEIQRYNNLLNLIRNQLTELEKGIHGIVVMSSDLEEIFQSLYDGRVPKPWTRAYASMKPLASWARDLVARVDHFAQWAVTTHPPKIFWLSAFTFPSGFLTAVLQAAARQNNIPVDTLSWDFQVLTTEDSNITGPSKEGVYVNGLSLQGAGWDKKNATLVEAVPMQLVTPMPSILFRPVENKKKSTKGLYICPTYYTPNRAGVQGQPSFVVAVELKIGERPPEHWIKRGVALLLSLDT